MKTRDIPALPSKYFIMILGIALFARILFILLTDPYLTPDLSNYLTVANNIYQNFCISGSEPQSRECVPSWGGNQLPGYPVLIALTWSLIGKSTLSILILQSLLASLAICRLTYAILVHTQRYDVALSAGMLLSLSPLDVGFSRAVLTETLAIGTTEWVLAELILSLAERRLRLVPLGLALVAAIFIRYDAILLCLLTAGVGFHLHPFGTAVRRGAVVALIVTLPLTGWLYRSVAVGLSYFPSPATTREGLPYASHIMQWGMTWIDTPEQMARFGWPLLEGSYSSMRVPPSAYVTRAEREEVERLLAALSRQDLKPVPSEIENAFASLAIARKHSYPLTVFVYKPIMRVVSLWGDVYSSYGWPIGFRTSQSVKIADAITHGGARGWVAMILKYPLQATGKILLSGYKFLVILIFIFALCITARQFTSPNARAFDIVWGLCSYPNGFFCKWSGAHHGISGISSKRFLDFKSVAQLR